MIPNYYDMLEDGVVDSLICADTPQTTGEWEYECVVMNLSSGAFTTLN